MVLKYAAEVIQRLNIGIRVIAESVRDCEGDQVNLMLGPT